jgi:DNA-binding winged helix-turn-helix (wHTH) protein/tetratricopeptide (TPR) repeat protein
VAEAPVTQQLRFGPFELTLPAGELRKRGALVTLQEQPLKILTALLERPGQLVTREELRNRLWSGDTFVDYDRGLNAAVNRLRDALGDSAETPRFIETVPRRGYRFIGSVAPVPVRDAAPQGIGRRWWAAAVLGVLVPVIIMAGARWLGRGRADHERQAAVLCDRALLLIESDKPHAAERLLDDAIRMAPEMPRPYVLRAWAMSNRGAEHDRVMQVARQAVARLTSRTDPTVRYFTRASYWHLERDLDRAAAEYEALLQLNADDYWAANNLARILADTGQHERAVPLFARLADLRSSNIGHQADAARALFVTGDFERSQNYARKACDLLRRSGTDAVSWAPWACALDLYVRCARGEPQPSMQLPDIEGFTDEQRDMVVINSLGAALAFGYARQADAWASRISSNELRIQSQAATAYVRGRWARSRQLLDEFGRDTPVMLQTMGIIADVGLGPLLQQQLALQPDLSTDDRHYVMAEELWTRGERAGAARLLAPTIPRAAGRLENTAALSGSSVRLLRSLLLQAREAELRGEPLAAIGSLEEAVSYRTYACRGEPLAPPLWLRAQAGLVRLYGRTGQEEQARSTEALIRRLLARADPEFVRWVRTF